MKPVMGQGKRMTHAGLLLSDHVLYFKMYLPSWNFRSLVFLKHYLLKMVNDQTE